MNEHELEQQYKLRSGTMFFFHHAKWSPVGVILVLTGLERGNRWHFRQLDTLEIAKSVYVDDEERLDITIVGQLPPDELDATVFKPSYNCAGYSQQPPAKGLVGLLKKLW